MIRRSIRVFLFVALLFLSIPVLASETVGKVSEVTGGVFIIHAADGKMVPAAVGFPVFLKDIIETKKDGAVQMAFIDGTTLVLREKTKIIVLEFLFDAKKRERQTVFDVVAGKVKAVVSKTFNKANSKTEFKTPTAVVGVRGTDLALDVSKGKTIVYCLAGLVEVFNANLPSQIVRVAAGTFTNVLKGMIPSLPIPIPQELLDAIEYQFGFPTSVESLKQRGLDELRRRLPF